MFSSQFIMKNVIHFTLFYLFLGLSIKFRENLFQGENFHFLLGIDKIRIFSFNFPHLMVRIFP